MEKYQEMFPTQKGTVGVGYAISYFCSLGYTVSLPIHDNQKYDLLVDINGEIKKVQVKSTGYKVDGVHFSAELRTICPKKTSKNQITKFDPTKVDLLFIITTEKTCYLIPTNELECKTAIKLVSKYDKFIVGA